MHPDLRRLDLNLLPVFDALYRRRSVTGAAHELAMSASAFSHALARLRSTLGDELFVRQGQRMQPTVRAEQMATPIAGALKLLQDSISASHGFDPATSQRTFVFSATDYTTFAVLPSLIARLHIVAPQVHIRIIYSSRKVSIEELAAGRIDFALGYSEERDPLPDGVEDFDWLSDDYVVIASRHHPRIRGSLTLDNYLQERHAVVTPWNETRGMVDHVLDGLALKREVSLHLPTVLAAPFIIAGSELIMTIPRQAAQTLSAAAPVSIYQAPFAIPPYAIKVYCHSNYLRTDAHAWMRQELLNIVPLSA
ncbi:LysR family transcriptional regulator [Janthinobacterium agaricidamnosum]|uniref:Putative transcriptional regulator n=1 Tax=Janthinobacterium agaricidamnosum NBRC 102515 = DSM 9628 TaxID=1349767 RepID=W0V075_9BURK|nr:LysR family transcriptional regulator [Janthinobacterium agaricidamnosum]CDG81276.1 putative transcriptional regulator [Janthinobacterium agaricidamnosum NBRC 102515 = DSM 9628]